jgi:asparaginyl-tRNA synthetase
MAPAFRAELSDTNRHLSEFWMVEAELAFTKTLDDVMDVAEEMIKATVPTDRFANDLIESHKRSPEKQELMQDRWKKITNNGSKWPKVAYTEAIDILNSEIMSKSLNLKKVVWGDSLASEHEKHLAGQVFDSPVFVTDYPLCLKPFYMKKSMNGDRDTVSCFDLLIPDFGELVGGSLREDNYDELLASMQRHHMNVSDMQWYLDLRKYGSFPHGGFGMGFERLVCYMCGVDNIMDAIGFPRWAGSCLC